VDPADPTRHDEESDMTAQTDIQSDTAGTVTTVYKVSGMSCGHCEGAVSGEISVVSAAPLEEEAVRAAVDEAGFELVGRA
jgi:copper chaperone CopZ